MTSSALGLRKFFTRIGFALAFAYAACSGATRETEDADGGDGDGDMDSDSGHHVDADRGGGDGDGDGDSDGDSDGTWEPSHPENFGEPGWRESTEPLCRPDLRSYSDSQIWADERGVFIYLSPMSDPFGGGAIFFNNGTGWDVLFDLSGTDYREYIGFGVYLTGIPDRELLIASDFDLLSLDPLTSEINVESIRFQHLFIHSDSLGYGISREAPGIFRFDGNGWAPLPGDPMPFEALRVWGNENTVFAVGDNGMILSAEDGEWIVHDTGTTDTFSSVWGFSRDNVYAGTYNNKVYHYDGSSWESIAWHGDSDLDLPCIDQEVGLWGTDDGTLFAYDSVRFVRILDGHYNVLGHWLGRHELTEQGTLDCADHFFIHAIWGISPTDVFLVISESQEETQHCEEFIVWWNGAEFHWF